MLINLYYIMLDEHDLINVNIRRNKVFLMHKICKDFPFIFYNKPLTSLSVWKSRFLQLKHITIEGACIENQFILHVLSKSFKHIQC